MLKSEGTVAYSPGEGAGCWCSQLRSSLARSRRSVGTGEQRAWPRACATGRGCDLGPPPVLLIQQPHGGESGGFATESPTRGCLPHGPEFSVKKVGNGASVPFLGSQQEAGALASWAPCSHSSWGPAVGLLSPLCTTLCGSLYLQDEVLTAAPTLTPPAATPEAPQSSGARLAPASGSCSCCPFICLSGFHV